MEQPRYGTWIRTRPIVILAVLTGGFLALGAALAAAVHWLFLILLVPAGVFTYILLIVAMSRWRFSPAGGNYQGRVHNILVDLIRGERVLDIGCGSGHLLAQIAKAHPDAELAGIDYWGNDWEYSQEQCLANFRAEGLDGRARFVRGSAVALPADLGEFDTVVSCLTFHEVADAADKTASIREALGRLKAGGTFAFIDLFGDPKYYPNPAARESAIVESGGVMTQREPLANLVDLPFPLGHKRVLGHAQLIAGYKRQEP